jgi:predicted secreted protein
MSTDTITVTLDDEFTLSLKSLATAGYLWKIESLPKGIQLLDTEKEKPSGDAKPGDSTGQIFRFRAQKTGEHKIKFALGRPWENRAIESKTVTVKVT